MAASGFKLFPNRIAALTSQTGIVGRFTAAFAQDVVVRAALNAPHETGALARDIKIIRANFGSDTVILKVGANVTNPRNGFQYARVVHTGAKARKAKDPARPMRFKPRRSNKWVTTLRVGPIPSQPYLLEGLREANVTMPSGQKFRIVAKPDTRGPIAG